MKRFGENLTKIVSILADRDYHDGTSLGHQLGISRTAVWKVIKKLEGYQVPIKSVKGKGYALRDPLILLDQQKIKKLVKTKPILIDVFEQISSTNDYLKTFCQSPKRRVCLAETQTQGRGRFRRSWHSPFGQNIYLSLLYPFNQDISELAGLSLVVSLAICKAIESMCLLPQPISIKWPNDIVFDHKKLAGSLIDIQAETHGRCYAIIGVGVNVNMQKNPHHNIDQPWISLSQINNSYWDRNILCAELINQLIAYIERFKANGFYSLIKEWELRDCLRGQWIRLKSGQQEYQGQAESINERGHLIVKLEDLSHRAFSSGDATLLK